MRSYSRLLRQALCLLLPVSLLIQARAKPADLAPFQAQAAASQMSLVLPTYPLTPDEVKAKAEDAIKTAEAGLAALAAQDPTKATFASTFANYDAIGARVGDAYAVIGTVAESALDKTMRDTANEMSVKLQEWSVGLDYRADLYKALKAFADTKPKLDAQEQRLVDDQMRSYRRAGLSLPATERTEVEKLRKDLAGLTTEFAVNINNARAPLDFTADEMAGVPQSFLDSPGVKQADGKYRVLANVTWHAVAIAENAENASTRRAVNVARNSLARETNVPVLSKLVALRGEIARRLGYATWADYQTEGQDGQDRRHRGQVRRGAEPGPAAQVRRRDGNAARPEGEAYGQDRRPARSLGHRLLHQQAPEGPLRRRYRGAARLLPLPGDPRRHVRHLPEDLRPEVHRGHARPTCGRRACSSMSCRTPPPARRWAPSTSTCSRATGSSTTSPASRRRPAA